MQLYVMYASWGMLAGMKYPRVLGPHHPPEVFLDYGYYDYSADMWMFGCLIGKIIFQFQPTQSIFRTDRTVTPMHSVVNVSEVVNSLYSFKPHSTICTVIYMLHSYMHQLVPAHVCHHFIRR